MAEEKKKTYEERLTSGFYGKENSKISDALKRLVPASERGEAEAYEGQPKGQYENKKPRRYGGRY